MTGLPIAYSRPDNSPDQLSHLFSRDTRRCPVLNSYASVISAENGRTPFSLQSQYTLVSPGCRFLLHKDTGCGNGSRTADLPAKESLPTTVLLFLPAAADLLLESHSAKIWYRGGAAYRSGSSVGPNSHIVPRNITQTRSAINFTTLKS